MTAEFRGTERFRVIEKLGAGGMGVVYSVYDTLRDARVALKTLHRLEPAAIYRLKQEFRSLAEMVHPNLVTLHELVSEGDDWFFTMDLVDGVSFLEWVREDVDADAALGVADTVAADTLLEPPIPSDAVQLQGGAAPRVKVLGGQPRVGHLRAALRQLAGGIKALHDAGKLHRDIKPSNVMVAADGRVVILDFGLVTELESVREEDVQGISGTIEYMAPEQAESKPPVPASDWYAVGAMTYQALCGRLPHTGSPLKVLLNKRMHEPVPVSVHNPDVPPDLDQLCMDLLRRDPADRPDGDEIMRRLMPTSRPTPAGIYRTTTLLRTPLVGRDSHLQALDGALQEAAAGLPITVYVHGGSGMGKSSLVRRFLQRVNHEAGAVVLAGRCYERESVPYKALDSVIDEMSRYLMGLPQPVARALVPDDVHALTRLFPVLLQVDAVAEKPPPAVAISDPREVRQRAFEVLRALWRRMARGKKLVIYVDDMQWGDADSAALLADVMRPPDAPPLMLLGCYRSEEAESSSFLKLFRGRVDRWGGSRDVAVGPLNDDEARDLALHLLGEALPRAGAGAMAVAKEARGNPYFVEVLIRHLQAGEAFDARALQTGGLTLANVRRANFEALPADARRLLTIVGVAGRPLAREAARVAAAAGEGMQSALALLRSRNLVRVRAMGENEALECYHDRIRETVVADLLPETRRMQHQALADALESLGLGDAETLAEHFLEAGDLRKTRKYTASAAARAAGALAFDRAAELYERALRLHREAEPGARAEESKLLVRLGEARVNAGRGELAARAFLDAAPESPPELALELTRRAGEQLLISGHIDEGKQVLEKVLAAIDMVMPATPARALTSLLWHRARIRMRGLGFKPTLAKDVSTSDLMKIDATWSAAVGLGLVDHIRAADFQARTLLLSLDAGERYRIGRAISMEVTYSTASASGRPRALKLAAISDELAAQIEHPHVQGLAEYGRGVSAFQVGLWTEARDHLERAATIFRERTTGLAWEAATTQIFLLASLAFRGDLGELVRRVPRLLDEAVDRGNVYLATSLRTGYPALCWLAQDQPERAEAHVQQAMREWSKEGFHIQHYFDLVAETHLDLYRGNVAAAWQRLEAIWAPLESSMLPRLQLIHADTLNLRARVALAAAAEGIAPQETRAIARKVARKLARVNPTWTAPLAEMVFGGLAAQAGEVEKAVAHYTAAEAGFDALDMAWHRVAAERRHGLALGGEAGQALVERADVALRARGVRDPVRMSRVI